MRILEERGAGQPDLLQQRVGHVASLLLVRSKTVYLHRLHQDLADREAGVERGIGVLEDDLDPALVLHRHAGRHGKQVLAFEQDLPARGFVEAHHGQSNRCLAGARFPDQPQRLTLGELEGHVADRLEFPFPEQSFSRVETLPEVANFDDDSLVPAQAAAALRSVRRRGWRAIEEIVDDRQPPGPPRELGPAEQKRLSVAVLRRLEYSLHRTLLSDLAVAHHDHVIRDFADHGQIVGNEQHRHPPSLLHLGDQIENLLLNGHVERRRRFVCDQQLRLACDRHRNHHALLLAARQLKRIRVYLRLRLRNPDLAEQFDRARPCLPATQAHMLGQDFDELEADGEQRVQGAHRLLKDHRYIAPAKLPHFAVGELQEIAIAVQNPAVGT